MKTTSKRSIRRERARSSWAPGLLTLVLATLLPLACGGPDAGAPDPGAETPRPAATPEEAAASGTAVVPSDPESSADLDDSIFPLSLLMNDATDYSGCNPDVDGETACF